MRHFNDLMTAGFIVLLLPGCTGIASRNSKTMDAAHYEIKVAESALHYSHGNTR